jgi:hypothetical protein
MGARSRRKGAQAERDVLATLDRNLKAAYLDAISRGADIDASEIVGWCVREMRDGECVAWWNLLNGRREELSDSLVPDWSVFDERK